MKSAFTLLLGLLVSAAAFSQDILQSSNLPIVVINTYGQEIPDDPKIDAAMGIIYNGEGQRNRLTDPFNEYDGKIAIEIRGQSSQMFPMKSYSLDLKKASGSSLDQSLLGMPAESDWVLYAPYTDKTLMRNVLAYTLAARTGHWAPRCRFVELMLNNDYKGVYVLLEKIKRGKNRVDIPKIGSSDLSGDALTGGYIFSLDKQPDGWYSTLSQRQYSFVYPKLKDIAPAQADYIESYVRNFESSLQATNFQDPVSGVRKYADLASFIDYFIINEISRNVDGYRLSSYFHKKRESAGGKIVAGPVWDYDLAFRNADYCNGWRTDGWAYRFNDVCPGDPAGLVPFWWNRFMLDTAFVSDLRCRWIQLRADVLSDQSVNRLIDSAAAVVDEARQRHFTRWPVLGQYIWPNASPIPASYSGEISTLKAWLKERMAWIDNNLPDKGACASWPAAENGSFVFTVQENPVGDRLQYRVQSRETQKFDLAVYDMTGRLVARQQIQMGKGNLQGSIPANWQRGIYQLRLRNAVGETSAQRLLKR